ncbi:MAG: hypothetical protein HY549_06510 [Elusimicrobia bacterium]|nr:hypothetical protein [Elusimicrobiota bacterium]
MNGEVPGSYTPEELTALSGFTATTLVCPAEGEILEKNWRNSGEFDDIIRALHERDQKSPPAAPVSAPDPGLAAAGVNHLIDTTGARLFNHVANLMKELETRQEERNLIVSLQRQVIDLREQLNDYKRKTGELESKIPRIAELEQALLKEEAKSENLQAAVKKSETSLSESRFELEKVRIELEGARKRLAETSNDLAIRNRLVDKLSRDLSEKEVSLAKALDLIRRLEDDLGSIHPLPPPASRLDPRSEEESEEASAAPEPPSAINGVSSAVSESEEKPAVVDFVKKFISKYDH